MALPPEKPEQWDLRPPIFFIDFPSDTSAPIEVPIEDELGNEVWDFDLDELNTLSVTDFNDGYVSVMIYSPIGAYTIEYDESNSMSGLIFRPQEMISSILLSTIAGEEDAENAEKLRSVYNFVTTLYLTDIQIDTETMTAEVVRFYPPDPNFAQTGDELIPMHEPEFHTIDTTNGIPELLITDPEQNISVTCSFEQDKICISLTSDILNANTQIRRSNQAVESFVEVPTRPNAMRIADSIFAPYPED